MTASVATLADVRARGWCLRGARRWAGRYGIDWNLFIREGVPLEQLDAIDDDYARQLAQDVRHGRNR